MSFLNPILAQAAADPEKATGGTVITAMMFLMASVGSLAMICAWVIRYSQTGHALPAARRGVLRVPWPLTLVAIVLSVLVMVFSLLKSFAGLTTVPNTVATQTPAVTETSNADGSTVLNSQAVPDANGKVATTPANTQSVNPAEVREQLIVTIGMELMMLLAFGTVLLVASKAGRVYLTERMVQHRQAPGQSVSMTAQPGRAVGAGTGFGAPWPDLDDASSIPQLPGYDILGNRGVIERGSTSKSMTAESPESLNPPASPASQETAKPVEHNPMAVVLEDEPFGTDSIATLPAAAVPQVADEPFSFVRELRFAAEVFLAAYLPTTALRLLIVLISIGIVGEPPDSHPFLEMLKAGVSVPMIVMILFVAVFVAPIVEELQFRVVVLGGIAQLGKPVLALFVSSIVFAFAHGFPDSIALIPLALALGYAYLRRRSYVTVMLVHLLFNGFNMILALVALL